MLFDVSLYPRGNSTNEVFMETEQNEKKFIIFCFVLLIRNQKHVFLRVILSKLHNVGKKREKTV